MNDDLAIIACRHRSAPSITRILEPTITIHDRRDRGKLTVFILHGNLTVLPMKRCMCAELTRGEMSVLVDMVGEDNAVVAWEARET